MNFKQKIFARCFILLNEKINELQNNLQILDESAESATKSSAGDKHETARAMIQIEQEKTNKQLNDALVQKSILEKIDVEIKSSQIIKGSLVKTNGGYLFVGIALGKIMVEDTPVIVLSPQSPLGIKLIGLKINDSAEINGVKYSIENIN